ncbi:MAG TPA: hypothetical protein VE291_13400 [Terracidiphilus sp.]|jgi:hypothetical protein|nr:hypothetical protein [Terracidiphilus sp.]
MKATIALALFGICLISGCHGYAHLYPVQGPLAQLTPPPVYTAKITLEPNWSKPVTVGAHANDRMGKLAVVLADGEQFNGPWKQVYEKAGSASAAAESQNAGDMSVAWNTVYGNGYYTAHVLGSPLFVHTELTGSSGTVLVVEWFEKQVGENDSARLVALGVAKDSKGNTYKLVF